MQSGVRLAAVAFVLTWLPITVFKGLAMGRSFRVGRHGQDAVGPLIDAMVQVGFAALAPALLVALVAFAFSAWREERRLTQRRQ